MSQQVINIGAAPNDGGGDQLRASFNKCNDNFTELYAKGVIEGLWNYNKTSTDTSTSPVSGRFKTNSGNYRDATQIAIHAITIQGIDRTSTLRALLVGDSIQCQDSTNSAAWCRYNLQSLPVDHGTWFQLNVTFQTDGGVTSGDNQEIVFVFTASSGGGSDLSAYALLASPTFTGDPQAPTPTTGDNDFSIATTAFVQDAVSSASGGAAGTAEYNFSTTISPPPNSGDIRVNNATPSAVTILWINNVTRLGSDIKRILQQIQVGSKVVIQDKGNSANYGAFQVAGALVDQTTYWEIPVTFSVGAGTIANNARILFGVQAPGATANVSNSGTPTAAQYAKWTDATHIQGVASATVLSDIGAAPLASPVFTGDPQSVTPAATDNDTSVATTGYVRSVVRDAYGVRGLSGSTSGTAGIVVSYHECLLHDSAGVGVLVKSGSSTIASGTVGANGCDVALSNGDVSVYAIWGSVPGAAMISSNANPPTGPALPATYTHWAYLTTLKRSAGNFFTTTIKGNTVFYNAAQNIANNVNTNTWASYSTAGYVPSIAKTVILNCLGTATTNAAAGMYWYVGSTSGNAQFTGRADIPVAAPGSATIHCTLPNVSQAVWHQWVAAYNIGNFTGSGFYIDVVGYEIPNDS